MLYVSPLTVRPCADSIQAAFSRAELEASAGCVDRVVELGLTLCAALAQVTARRLEPLREVTEDLARYMSPEQACGLACDVRSDLYSVGCILFEVAEGRAPFVGSVEDVVLDHVMVRPPAVRRMPRAVAAIIERLLAKEPADRFTSVDELRRALEAARTLTAPGDDAALSAA